MKNSLLRAARRKKGWSQQQLADFAGLSRSTIERAERGEPIRVDSIQRLCECLQKTPEQLGLLAPEKHDTPQILNQDQLHTVLCSDYLSILENDITSRWSLYHTGGTNLAYQGLNTLVQHILNCVNLLRGDHLYERALRLLSLGYQLQGSVYRDLTCYPEAHVAHRKALLVARELFDPELIAAALVREGITFNQQESPKAAITYFNLAVETIKHLGYIKLEGYILQALSEAQAKAQQSRESWHSISLAEKTLERQPLIPEQSLIRLNTASLIAQKGVNAMLLHDYKQAIELIDNSLAGYDPALIRGRARLLTQKAEAYYGLGILDACVHNAQDAFMLARSAGSSKIMNKVKTLHTKLIQSKWRKDPNIADLGNVLTESLVESGE
ncbi:helix-turn-helix protein [Planifilum fimeticola]|uniref:Helix-turn-helix protein n=1 Tax=Planifilum fimeticola TaxID=201975 RepID=A0A2T0LFC5_9BACL|nr:helix-turn-helix transcriptional regulator [Planifilum fimeticola]PRX40896.1 helix-turn-helix protein [Planifilum fimeticola]